MAQNNSITASPMAFSFCVATNNSPAPPAQTLTVSAVGGNAVGYNANSFPSWVRLNGVNSFTGSTSANPTLAITIDPSAYSGGGTTQSGTIQVVNPNTNPITIPVTVTVTSTCANASGLTATPSSVTLSTTQTAQGVTIAGPSGTTITAAAFYGTGNPSGWFGLSGTSLTAGQTVTVSLLSATGLTSGAQGQIVFTQNGTNNSVTVPVIFNTTTGTGNGVFTASPTSVGVSFTSALDSPKTQTVNITGPNAQVVASANLGTGPAGWITVSQQGGPVPTSFQITVSPASLPTGTTTGSVTVSQSGTSSNFVTIPVSATVGNGPFTYTPNPLTFTAAGGAVTQQNQTLTITGTAGAQVVANATVNNGASQWLTFNGFTTAFGTLTNGSLQLTVTVNPVNLAPNQTFTGAITIMQGSTTVLTIPVTVTTTGNPTLTFNPTQLNFAWQIGTLAPQAQTINVTSTAGTQVNFTPTGSTSNCGNWLVVSPNQATVANGTTPTPITVQITTAGLPSTTQTCSGNIQISAPGASDPTTNIPVSLLVSVNPLLLVSPSSLSFNSSPGTGVPQSQTVQVTSSTPNSALTFTTTVTPATSGGPNFLIISQPNPATASSLTFSINSTVLAGLAAGTYVDNVQLNSPNAGNPTITIPVTLTVANTATLSVNPTSVVMNSQIGTGIVPPVQVINVSSTGAPIQFTAAATSNCNNFLGLSQTSGNTLSSTGTNGTPINISANVTGITTPTVCSGTITLTPAGGGTAVTVNVTLNVVNTPVINVGVTSIMQTVPAGSTTPIIVVVPLTSTDGATSISFTAIGSTSPAGQSWLAVSPNTGTTANNVQVRLDPTGLQAGTYTGTITVTDNNANSAVRTQTIPVTFVVAAQATVNPTSLTFTAALNGTNPATQTITVGGVPTGTTISATPSALSCGSGWLSATVSLNTVTVGVTTTNLTTSGATVCNGSVAINVGGSTVPINVPVVVNVTNTSLVVTTSNVTFSYAAGSSVTPGSQTVQLTATNGATVPFTATFAPNTTATPAGLVTITPASGTTTGATPVNLTLGLSQTALLNLTAGTYGGVVTIASPNLPSTTINVTVTVSQPPPPTVTSIVNSATLQPGLISPGEIITIFGSNIGPATPANLTLTSAGKVSTSIGGTQVFFDGTAAPLIYVSANQINAIVPYEVNGRLQTTMTITTSGITSPGIVLRVTDTAPGIFTTTQTGSGQGAILNQNGTVNSFSTPAPKGSVISIYATGEGVLNPPGTTGGVTPSLPPFPKPTANVQVTFQTPGPNGTTVSVPATITYAGEAPSLVSGALQVNVIVPASVPSGANTIVLTVGNNSSPSVVTVQVQ